MYNVRTIAFVKILGGTNILLTFCERLCYSLAKNDMAIITGQTLIEGINRS